MSGDERLNVDRALSQAKDALKGTDVEALKKAHEELTTARISWPNLFIKRRKERAGRCDSGRRTWERQQRASDGHR